MLLLVSLLLLSTASLVSFILYYRARTLPIRGPKTTFFWGNFRSIYRNRERIPDWFYEQTVLQDGKTWSFSMPNSPPMVCVTTPENLKYVLKDHFGNFEKGILFREVLQELLGDGIFNTDGSQWHAQRRLAMQQFKRKSLHMHMSKVMIAHSEMVVKLLESKAQNRECIDLQKVFFPIRWIHFQKSHLVTISTA